MADGAGSIIKAGVSRIPFSDGLRGVFGAGKKGGAGSGSTPSETPNTLQSNAIVRVVEALSEGEIRGPAIGGEHRFTGGAVGLECHAVSRLD